MCAYISDDYIPNSRISESQSMYNFNFGKKCLLFCEMVVSIYTPNSRGQESQYPTFSVAINILTLLVGVQYWLQFAFSWKFSQDYWILNIFLCEIAISFFPPFFFESSFSSIKNSSLVFWLCCKYPLFCSVSFHLLQGLLMNRGF